MIYSVTFVAQGTAEGMPGHPSQAVISITTPAEGHADLADFGHMLRLQFHDVEENGHGENQKAG